MSIGPQLDVIVQGLKARPLSTGSYSAQCPCHDDKSPSLSISKPNGKILFHCHAGCAQDDVISALQDRGLWPKAERRIVATYPYPDVDGVLQFEVVRYAPKDFRQRRPDGAGGWIWNLRGIKVLPYNLPNVVKAIAQGETIAIVEGEKDVENLRKIGITATANAGGAGKWKRDHSEYLRGARAIILPDNDPPGRAHAQQVAASLQGIAASVSILELPGLPDKGDVSDWLANGGTREQLDALFAEARPTSEPFADLQKVVPDRFPLVWLDDAVVELKNDDYVKGLIGRRAFILIYGPSGDGKTFFAIDLFSHIAGEIDWRGRRVRGCLVVYIAAEAGVSIVRRFFAWRSERVSEAREGRIPLAIITRGANLLNPVDVEALIVELKEISAVAGVPLGAVVIDTFSRSTGGGNENSPEDMTTAIESADRLRDELGVTVAFVHHSGKDPTKGSRGHSSLYAAADTVISVIERVATVEKSRDGISGEQFPFDLQVVELGQDEDGDKLTTCVVLPSAVPAAPRKVKALSGVPAIAFNALEEAISEHGKLMPGTSVIPPNVKAVTLEQWRSRFELRYGTDTNGSKRESEAVGRAFRRGREALIPGYAVIADPYVWLARRGKTVEVLQ